MGNISVKDQTELWEEDEFVTSQINHVIGTTREWGTLPGSLKQILQASLKAKINWRNIMAGFRASILSSRRKLTRMRPDRRTGFEAMGSVRKFNTRLLVAVDVSGSVSDASLSDFFGVVNSAFRYGFESVDYAHENGYEGLVILTDGYAARPRMPLGMKTRILWACADRRSYDENREWMENLGRVCMKQTR